MFRIFSKKKEDKSVQLTFRLLSTASQYFLVRYYDPKEGRYFIHEGRHIWEKLLSFEELPKKLELQVYAIPTIRPLNGTISLALLKDQEIVTTTVVEWQPLQWLTMEINNMTAFLHTAKDSSELESRKMVA